MSIMFANTTRGASGTGSGHLVEFKAGRTLLEAGSTPEKRKAVADKSKGLVYIKQSSDQLMHFCWKNREKNTTDLDLIIFPGDTEFVRIKECTEGRVYMLKFKSGESHQLFWLQDSKIDKDDENAKKVNDLLNNPPARTLGRSGGSERPATNTNALAALNSAIAANSDEIGALGTMDQTQIMQLFSLMNGGNTDLLPQLSLNANSTPSPTATETPKIRKERPEPTGNASSSSGNKFDAAMLNKIISSLPTTSESTKQPRVELSKVLTRKNVEEVVKSNSETLTPHLPATNDEREINQTIGSPQFQQAADFFSSALNSGQLGPALSHFNLGENVIKAADTGDLVKFSKELTNSQQKKDSKEIDAQINAEAAKEESNENAANKDEEMDLD
jgi:26S proteasome regulatory subunit N13